MAKIFANNDRFRSHVEFVYIEERGQKQFLAAPLTLVEAAEGEYFEPTFRLTREESQALIDELWECGLRPSQGVGSVGALDATQRHLKDLQRIVFKDFDK